MKTVYWVIAVIVVAAGILLLIAFGRPPSVSEATADFCTDVNAYARALLDLRTIDENSTVEDLEAAAGLVRDSYDALQASAAELSEARLAAVETSQEELQATVTSIPNDATLAQATAQLRLAALNALADTVEVMTTTCEVSLTEGATTLDQR